VVQLRPIPASKPTNAMPLIWVLALGLWETLGHRISNAWPPRSALSKQCPGELRGDSGLTDTTNCYRKAQLSSLKVGGLEVGVSGLAEIVERGLLVMDSPDDEVREVLLKEMRARNYVPSSAQEEYMRALWAEFRKARQTRREQLEMSYKGIPREDIPWYPKVDEKKCSGCSSCVEFCTQSVFSFDGRSHVIKPYNCIVGNSSCRSFCPEKAISFPTTNDLKTTLAKLKEKYGQGT
jgi:NAD-dependent dihydropyrimidine dehydrogenase PreA subunit